MLTSQKNYTYQFSKSQTFCRINLSGRFFHIYTVETFTFKYKMHCTQNTLYIAYNSLEKNVTVKNTVIIFKS